MIWLGRSFDAQQDELDRTERARSVNCSDVDCDGWIGGDDCCTRCGVDHSETCPACGRAGFHATDCPNIDDRGGAS